MPKTPKLRRPVYVMEDKGRWLSKFGSLEVILRGNEKEVDAASLALAKAILPGIAALEREGREYLHGFVDPTRFQDMRDYYKIKEVGDWKLMSVDFGERADLRQNDFELLFTLNEDVYGLWSVRFEHLTEHGVCGAVEFRRRCW